MQNNHKKLIIFDMDGTLIDSGDTLSTTINFVRKNLSLPPINKKELLENMNNPDINSSQFFYGTAKFTEQQTKLFSEYYHENCLKGIFLYEGIVELLENISKYFVLTIATNASVPFAQKMLQHLGIQQYFNFIIGSDSVQLPKPHPEMLLSTLAQLKIKADHSIIIGDSTKDKNAAQACDMDYFLVNWGFSHHENHHNVINSIEILHTKLLELKK